MKGSPLLLSGSVLVMLADTLAAHTIGGFKSGVGFALWKCRNCLATQTTMNTEVTYNNDSYFEMYVV